MRIMASPTFAPENPYVGLLYSQISKFEGVEVVAFNERLLRKEPFDIVHIHWPEQIFWGSKSILRSTAKALYLLAHCYAARRRGAKVFWTVHNLKPHDLDRVEALTMAWYWPLFLLLVDAHISLSHSGQDLLLRRVPRMAARPGFVIPHGHYRATYPNDICKPEARADLGISDSATVIAFVGLIREYKNLPRLIDCFRQLPDRNLILVIAGKPISEDLRETVSKAAQGDDRIICTLRFVPADKIQTYLNASDLVVLPFAEVLNSGSVLLALSFNRPVLTAAAGVFLELKKLVGESWVRTYDSALTSAQLNDAARWATAKCDGDVAPLDKLDWRAIGEQTVAAYRSLLT